MGPSMTPDDSASLTVTLQGEAAVTFSIRGRLDSNTTGRIWREATAALERLSPARLVVGASGVAYCDGSGVGLFVELQRRQRRFGKKMEILGLQPEFQQLLDVFDPGEFEPQESAAAVPMSIPEEVGQASFGFWNEAQVLIVFVGEVSVTLKRAFLKPRSVRWKDAFRVAETAGVDALPIIALISFLMGLILAFQSSIPMRKFGADIYVANLIGLSMLREMGPIMTAIVLAGRSGSAFAAELGTMKINEEIDAHTTMGLDPMRFLVIKRVKAFLIMTPLLTFFAALLGLIGGGVVLLSLGYPLVSYFNQVLRRDCRA